MADKSIHTGLCTGGNTRMQRLFELLCSDRVDPTPMTTHRFGFDEIEPAFQMMQDKSDGVIKPLLTFP